MAKSSKADAHYQSSPKRSDRCRLCTMFRTPRNCTAVQGDISPNGWCSYFKRTKRNTTVTQDA